MMSAWLLWLIAVVFLTHHVASQETATETSSTTVTTSVSTTSSMLRASAEPDNITDVMVSTESALSSANGTSTKSDGTTAMRPPAVTVRPLPTAMPQWTLPDRNTTECFIETTDVHGIGATLLIRRTLDDCKQACIDSSTCVAVDWMPSNIPESCWINKFPWVISTNETGVVTHYEIVRKNCPEVTTPMMIFLSTASQTESPGAAENGTSTKSVNITESKETTGMPPAPQTTLSSSPAPARTTAKTDSATEVTSLIITALLSAENGTTTKSVNVTEVTALLSAENGTTTKSVDTTAMPAVTVRPLPTAMPPWTVPDRNTTECWIETKDAFGIGGNSLSKRTLDDCKQACVDVSKCIAIDWVPSDIKDSCWINVFPSVLSTSITGVVTHYEFVRQNCPNLITSTEETTPSAGPTAKIGNGTEVTSLIITALLSAENGTTTEVTASTTTALLTTTSANNTGI